MTRRAGTQKSKSARRNEHVLRMTIMLCVAAWMVAVVAIMSGAVPPLAGIPLFGLIASVLGIVIMTSSKPAAEPDVRSQQAYLHAPPQQQRQPQPMQQRLPAPAAPRQPQRAETRNSVPTGTYLAVKRQQQPAGVQRSHDFAPAAYAPQATPKPYVPAPLPRSVPVPQAAQAPATAAAMPTLSVAPAPAPAPVRREIMAATSPGTLPVLTRGTMEGRSYAVFADGSIELETAFGPRWFASVDLAHEFIGFRNGASVLLGAQNLDDELAQVA